MADFRVPTGAGVICSDSILQRQMLIPVDIHGYTYLKTCSILGFSEGSLYCLVVAYSGLERSSLHSHGVTYNRTVIYIAAYKYVFAYRLFLYTWRHLGTTPRLV